LKSELKGWTQEMLDHRLANRWRISSNSRLHLSLDSVEIVRFPEAVDKNGEPRRFGRPSAKARFDETGFTDHLPVACRIVENGGPHGGASSGAC
jgi:hypothetical protein